LTAPSAVSRYRVFISYKHGADSAMAVALARALTRFARPWYQPRAMRVFLDLDSLGAAPAVQGALDAALAQSDWLLLLASPGDTGSAGSPWVAREVAWWLQHRGRERLIIARLGGDIVWQPAGAQPGSPADFAWPASTALTPALRGAFAAEPLWVDFQAAAASAPHSLGNPLFRDSFLGVAAAVHGRSKDALWSIEGEQQRRRALAAVGAAAAVGASALGAYNQWSVSMDRKQNLASIQLGAKAFSVLGQDPTLAAQLALAGVALRPSGIAASALRSAVARLGGAPASGVTARVPNAVDIAFSPDPAAATLAVLAADGSVTLVDSTDGRPLATLPAPAAVPAPAQASATAKAQALAWGQGGRLAVAGAWGIAWARIDGAKAVTGWQALPLPAVRAMAFNDSGSELLLAHADGTLRVLALPGGGTLRQVMGHPGGARAVAFNGGGTRLASGGDDGVAVLWDARTLTALARLKMPGPVSSVDFNRDGSSSFAKWMLAVADHSGALRVVDVDTPAGPALELPVAPAGSAARFVASGRCLARAGAAQPVQVLSTLGFEPLFALGSAAGAGAAQTMALATAATRRFATLDTAGSVTLHDQALCGDAEAVCRAVTERSAAAVEPRPAPLLAAMAPADRLRWLPRDDDAPAVQQPPGPACCRLIGEVLGSMPGPCRSAR